MWSKAGSRWTHELVGYALDRFHRRHLRTPTALELRHGIADLPSHPTIRRMYGSMTNMYRYHGYRVRPVGGQPGRDCTLERDPQGRFLPNRDTGTRCQDAPVDSLARVRSRLEWGGSCLTR